MSAAFTQQLRIAATALSSDTVGGNMDEFIYVEDQTCFSCRESK